MPVPTDHAGLTRLLEDGGFVAAPEEADELLAAADGGAGRLDALVRRRLTGEPLAWITGSAELCGVVVGVDPGVYVPRWQTEVLAARARERLPVGGTAIDACTGAGAIACVLRAHDPRARIVGTDADPASVACARRNGVEALEGDLLDPVPDTLHGAVDLVVAVVPYVPTAELGLLQRDTLTFESTRSYDGGPDGLGLLRRVAADARRFLRPGGALLLELGGDQDAVVAPELTALGYVDVTTLRDEDGDVRGIEATFGRAPSS